MSRNDKKKGKSNKVVASNKVSEKSPTNDLLVNDLAYMASGILTTMETNRDFKIDKFGYQILGRPLISETILEMNWGHRYGLIGLNGCGKSILLKVLGNRLVPLPKHIDVYLLDREVHASEISALDAVLEDVQKKIDQLEAEAEKITGCDDPDSEDRLQFIYEELDRFESDLARTRASKILHGLGFTKEMQNNACSNFSGGWRMRIALAKALFVRPSLLLLDEPTNHLDLEACVWLEDYLRNYDRILLIISHSQDFLNSVCTDIIHIQRGRLVYYTGNYDNYVKTRGEKEENQMKRYQWEQDQIKHMKAYIGRFGSGNSKMASQAKSKEKVLSKMESKGLTERVYDDKVLSFYFPSCNYIPPPVLSFNKVGFGYSRDKILYSNLDFGIDLSSRIALVGPNGIGKSTLLKLMTKQLEPLEGQVTAHPQLRLGYYNQHLSEEINEEVSPLEYMMSIFDESPQEVRKIIGRFGISGRDQTVPIKFLSDGIKNRVVFARIAYTNCHILLLDEPTNHLDMESIDSLANAINCFEGGMILVSHDFRLISQVAKEIWICTSQGIKIFNGTIEDYKQNLIHKLNVNNE